VRRLALEWAAGTSIVRSPLSLYAWPTHYLDRPQERLGFTQLLRLLLRTPPLVPSPDPGVYERGLARAQAVIDRVLADATRARQDSTAAEFQAWLLSLGKGIELSNTGPEYLLVFIEE
jgi:hypothetical protein